MHGSFQTRLSSKDKIILVITLISLVAWHFPSLAIGTAHAQTDESQKSLTFEIKSQNQNDLDKLKAQTLALAEMDAKVALVRNYLQSKNSPLANYTEILLAQDDWKTIISVSNAESNMGLHCYVNNCSGIFGSRGLRTYETIPDWIVDMQNLINQRYKGWTLNQMNGIYVYPRSNNWIAASSMIYNDLSHLESQFPSQQV